MRTSINKLVLRTVSLATAMLAATGVAAAAGTTTVNLTAYPTTAIMTDGASVPMWGYCGGTVANKDGSASSGTILGTSGACGAHWTPGPTIVVPTGDTLMVNLTNTLKVATSFTILGQLGGDLGKPTPDPSGPVKHTIKGTTWPVLDGTSTFVPPNQATRARAFVPEAAAGTTGNTYSYTYTGLKPGTYLYETGSHPSLQAPMGLYGVLIVTSAPVNSGTAVAPGTAFPAGAVNGVTVGAVSYDADAPFLISEVDAVQNAAVDAAAAAGTPESVAWNSKNINGTNNSCTSIIGGTIHCYPPAVNYAPTYLLLNGQGFDRNNPGNNATLVSALSSSGNVMLRVVNAGLRTHVPSLVGLPMSQIAEDGNRAPGVPAVQSELLMTAGKTRDVLIQPKPAAAAGYLETAYGFFDRSLGLSTNGSPNGGSQGYLAVVNSLTLAAQSGATPAAQLNTWLAGGGGKAGAVMAAAVVDNFTVPSFVKTYSGNVLTNDTGIYSVAVSAQPKSGTVTLNANGTFTYTANAASFGTGSDTFTYCGNGTTTLCAPVNLTGNTQNLSVTAATDSYTSRVATVFRAMRGEGVLANDIDSAGFPLTASLVSQDAGFAVTLNPDGSFLATASAPGTYHFQYVATDSQGAASSPSTGTDVAVTFLAGSKLAVTVQDALGIAQGIASTAPTTLTDYMWLIQEDLTFHTSAPGGIPPVGADGNPGRIISNSFHVSHNSIIAAGCTGPLSCGDSQTINGGGAFAKAPRSFPSDVNLDPAKHYFISVLPGDAGNAFIAGISGDPTIPGNCTFNTGTTATDCGHTLGGAQVLLPGEAGACPAVTGAPAHCPVTVYVDPNPLKPAQLAIFAFEDNNPTNGDIDEAEAGLGGFNIVIFDAAGRSGDPVGQITYDAFNMPLTNWLLGKPGCPNEENPTVQGDAGLTTAQQQSLVGTIYTCPDGHRNIVSIVGRPNGRSATVTTATPHHFTVGTAVDISGIGDPTYGALLNGTFTVTNINRNTFRIAVAIPDNVSVSINKGASVRDPAAYSLAGHALVKNIMPGRFDVLMHPSAKREGDGETWWQVSTLEGTPANDAFSRAGEPAYFQEFGPPGFHAFVGWINPDRINAVNSVLAGNNAITGRVTNLHMSRPQQIYNYDSGTREPLAATVCFASVNIGGTGANGAFAQCDQDGKFTLKNVPPGNHQVVVWDQWLDQIIAYFSVTVPLPTPTTPSTTVAMGDLPVFSWFTHVEENAFVYANPGCPQDAIKNNPTDQVALRNALNLCARSPLAQIPITVRFRNGAISNVLLTDSNGNATFNELFPLFNWYVAEVDQTRYAPLTAHVVVDAGGQPDCTSTTTNPDGTFVTALTSPCSSPADAGMLSSTYPGGGSTEKTYTTGDLYFGLQGFISETQKIDWGKTVLPPGQNGGFSGLVVYTSTRGFDDPSLEVQFMWEPLVPRVPVNLYKKSTAPDGSTSLLLVATTRTTSWDDVANGTYSDPINNPLGIAKPSCPGQVSTDPYVPQVLGTDLTRCYDGFHNWNQVQPETYDGYYQFATINPFGIHPDGTALDLAHPDQVAVPDGAYVIEIVPPTGYEIVKEEDKNILIGDAWVAPPSQQFVGLGNIFILPDQASVSSAYNLNGATQIGSRLGFVDGKTQFPLCAGSPHRVPDYLSLFPNSLQIAPFAGADRPLCDRKDVSIVAGQNGGANFYLFSNTPRAAEFTGIILDDASAEFNVAAPDFGEKFGVPYVAVSIRDSYGTEIERTYSDQWGGYNGMTPSTWQVNVPNPAGYSPNMLITCMNDPGPLADGTVDPQYMPTYSNFCYTNPFMPGLTTYLDTPVLPVAAFASNYVSGYNPVDCAYPDTTPAIARVDGDGVGPWLSPTGPGVLTINALGKVNVPNPAYLGPSTNTGPNAIAPYNQKTIQRTYTFGAAQGIITLGPLTNGVCATGCTTVPAGNVSWGDSQIRVTLKNPDGSRLIGAGAYELGITAANGKQSVDTVTVTVEAAVPHVVEPAPNSVNTAGLATQIQTAIDNAAPGDLIILDAGVYNELAVMWKPVRLQGVGAASVVINAAKYPTHKLELWRPEINKLFGVDAVTGNQGANSQVDPLPGQEITGGIVLLEPSVLATEEGAGITVLAKDPSATDANCQSTVLSSYGVPMSQSNFTCVKGPRHARIDGISVTGGDAGGGIYVNGWAHYLEIANNRVYGNAGAFGGGIRVGIPGLETQDLQTIQKGYNHDVIVHNNAITQNGMVEASGALGGVPGVGGAGAGLSMCTGANNYLANYNFICGNFSSGDGGGVGHVGYSTNGTIANNTIVFNQSYFQASTTSGGGIAIEGDAPVAGGLSLGIGSVTVDSNLIQGNYAETGHGGGVALIQVNGSDVSCTTSGCTYGNKALLTNNMIVDNVAGWSGGGISLADSLNVQIVNNTIAMNDSVGIVGAVFNGNTHGVPSPAGVASQITSATLSPLNSSVPKISNPIMFNNVIWHNRSFYGNLYGTLNPVNNVGLNGAAPYYSSAQLCSSNDWTDAAQTAATCSLTLNTTLTGGTTALTGGTTALQTLATGACDPNDERYWDLGVVGDHSTTLHPNGSLTSTSSVLTGGQDPKLTKAYCNSSQQISASSDEMGNFVEMRYGPLSLTAPVAYSQNGYVTAAGAPFADYRLADTTSSAYNTGAASLTVGTVTTAAPKYDYFGTTRPQAGAYDAGAHELLGAPAAIGSVTGGPFSFGNQAVQTTSSSQTLTLHNTGTADLTGITLNFAGPYSRSATTPGTCTGTTLAAAGTCTINVVFSPTATGPAPGTLTIGANVTVTGSPVTLTGNGRQGRLTFSTGGNTLPNVSGVPTWTVNSPLTRTLTVTNDGTVPTGTAGAVSLFAAPALSGVKPTAAFALAGGTCSTSTVLLRGDSCTIRVTYTRPTAANRPAAGTVTVTSNGLGSPQTVSLVGN